jgi:hypothetical protein
MALPSGTYAPRAPAASVLYQVVRDHYETFRVEAARLRDGEGLPRFVQEEFEAFLGCGWLAGGFARFQCTRCRAERLVAFSCKGRGFCPSCGGRRMVERAAHLVDHVWPEVPVRQWVLTLPSRARYVLAWRHDLCTEVAGVLFRAVHRHLRAWAHTRGLGKAQSGAIIVVQRFGGALNLNVHLHALVLDGVFARARDGRLRFHRAPAPTAADVADVLAAIMPGVRARLGRQGGDDDAGEGRDPVAEAAPGLAGLAVASVQGVLALGGVAGRRPQRLGAGRERLPERAAMAAGADRPHARWDGFDLHAGVVVPGHRARLERLCRYVLRPPVTGDRLSVAADGRVVLRLRHPWADGTTHLAFEPTAFLERLAVLIPRPRINLLLYYGVLAAHAAWRAEVVPRAAAGGEPLGACAAPEEPAAAPPSPAGRRWADLMRRAFEVDVLACPRCGGRLRLVALLEAGTVTARILQHLGLPAEVPAARPARAPPLARGDECW